MTANRTETQSIESDLDPEAIFVILTDPTNIPLWAPAFADKIDHDADNIWLASKDGTTFPLEVVATLTSRTVDYLRESISGRKSGAYLRVLPRPAGGSVVIMTIPIRPGADPQKAVVTLSEELNSLIHFCSTRSPM
jgi:hypothetical protein